MRIAIVNAAQVASRTLTAAAMVAASASAREPIFPGVRLGHAAPGKADRRDAACADDVRVLAHGAAVVCAALCLLVLNAPTLWPHLFAH